MNQGSSSKILFAATRFANRQKTRLPSGAGAAVRFLTLPPKSLGMSVIGDDEQDYQPQTQVAISPGMSNDAYHFDSSSSASAEYSAAWRSAVREISRTPLKDSGNSNQDEDADFDPILGIRALNPLLFESNHELQDYGPSFRQKVDDVHDQLIQEWRFRNEGALS